MKILKENFVKYKKNICDYYIELFIYIYYIE